VLARALRRSRAGHLHAHFANVPAAIAELVRILTGIPYSFTAHAKDIYLAPPDDLRRKIRGAEFVLTCTGFNQDYLRRISDCETPIQLAYHGVDLSLFQPAPAAAHVPAAAEPVILSIGRFCEKKGFPYLIQACSILKGEGRRFRCRIVGYGEMKEQLAAHIAELHLQDCVSLEGPLNQDQIIAVYRTATLFVLPCHVIANGDRDGIPNVLLEAMSMGIPVISTAISGISELIENTVNGLLVPERDGESVARAAGLLLDEPALRARLAENGRKTAAETFGLESSARCVLRAFEEFGPGEAAPLTQPDTKEAVAC
jgi:glycosyltransferase involved in cell wall biosynthesis